MLTFYLRTVGRNKTLSGQFQEEIISGNEEGMRSGADLVAQKKIQGEEKGLPRF